ncbi:Fic family protein [Agromyces aerolatus]|uniref:Fic family protein n=1 Tax=Agromyces sp. LY-1074 TaxID=3074080 RepID=UPI0028559422|nr:MULTISPECIES: Fic family protein [unclassified Agromyces]MDR5698808.1 Fic family protein [Agromyces sp. LY-1074]MDR5705414.1 Fic family protein [Agromyces sp. LY-1358]
MATHIERVWNPDDRGQLTRKDRRPGRYLAYVPDPLGVQLPELGVRAHRAAEDALTVLARADERIGERGRYLHHLLIRSESISSSWIEGNRVTPKKLAIAELLHHGPRVALDVVANVRATEDAIDVLADRGREITATDIEDLQHLIEPSLARGCRLEQNWVGGAGWSPLRADFVPPPETEVPRLVDDLAAFVTATDGNPVVRAAIAHAQFETIHPFIDGNGRTGRALIHTVFRRADALRNTLIPISTVFAGDTNAYIAGLTAFRADPQRLDDWVIGFAEAAELAAENAVRLAADVAQLDAVLADQLVAFRSEHGISPAHPRRDAAVRRILATLASDPVLTIDGVAARLDVTKAAAHRALVQLHDAGILGRTKDQRGRLVCWTADRHLALVAQTERSNRVSGRDTRVTRPRLGPPRPDTPTGP